MRDQIEDVLKFVADYCSIELDELTPSSSLFSDLRIDGDDAGEFMQAFSNQFGVDISEFNFSRYFGSEAGFNPVVSLFRSMLGRAYRFTPITLADLANAAEIKKWKEK